MYIQYDCLKVFHPCILFRNYKFIDLVIGAKCLFYLICIITTKAKVDSALAMSDEVGFFNVTLCFEWRVCEAKSMF